MGFGKDLTSPLGSDIALNVLSFEICSFLSVHASVCNGSLNKVIKHQNQASKSSRKIKRQNTMSKSSIKNQVSKLSVKIKFENQVSKSSIKFKCQIQASKSSLFNDRILSYNEIRLG